MIFNRKPTQSQSISGANISGAQVQQGQAGQDLSQTQQGNQAEQHNQGLQAEDIVNLLGQIETTIRASNLPPDRQQKAIAYLNAAQQEAQEPEPDKDLMTKNLKRMGDTITTANDTMVAGKTLWQTVQPLLLPVLGWMGVAASVLGL
jgi:hypothetical protein